MRRASTRLFAADLVWALFAAAFFTYKSGYLFGTGDHEELLPPIYRLFDPSLYPGSAFVGAAANVQPIRAAYMYTLMAAATLAPLHIAALTLHVLCLVASSLVLMRIARTLFPDAPWAAPLAPILTLTYFGIWTVGGNSYADFMLLPHAFAVTAGTASALFFLRRRMVRAGVTLGIAALYQPLLAGHLMWMLAAVRITGHRQGRWRDAALFGAAFLVAVSPLLIAQAMRDTAELTEVGDVLFARRYFGYRHALHYLPSTFPTLDWWHWGGLIAVALLLIFRYRHRARRGVAAFIGLGLLAMAIYTVAVEGFGILEVCAMQVFKASVWMSALAAVIIAGYVGKGLSALLPFSPARTAVLIIPVAMTFYCVAVVANVSGLSSRGLGEAWYRVRDKPYDDLGRIHYFLRDSTSRDAVVLTAPVDESLMCEGQRTTPVSHKGFLHDRAAFLRWDRLYHRIYHLPYIRSERERRDQSLQQTAVYDDLTAAHFDTVCHYNYRIARAGAAPDTAMREIRRDGDWLLLGRKRQ